ncbi:hypothetical protein C8Q74DRAFT_633859 [Fomes fomentarius]|nr:hypothetical protein C8Q74DRAFT_633859 [Fomes fomentarius]
MSVSHCPVHNRSCGRRRSAGPGLQCVFLWQFSTCLDDGMEAGSCLNVGSSRNKPQSRSLSGPQRARCSERGLGCDKGKSRPRLGIILVSVRMGCSLIRICRGRGCRVPWAPRDSGWVWQTLHTHCPVAKVFLLSSTNIDAIDVKGCVHLHSGMILRGDAYSTYGAMEFWALDLCVPMDLYLFVPAKCKPVCSLRLQCDSQ